MFAGNWRRSPVSNCSGARFIFFPHISNGKQDSRERRQIVPVRGGRLQVGDSALLIRGQTAHRRIQRTGAAMLPMMYLLKPVATSAS